MTRGIFLFILLATLALGASTQNIWLNSGARFRPFSYGELMRAMPQVTPEMIERAAIAQALDKAEREEKFEKWQSAAVDAYNKGNYLTCLTYINYALDTNLHNGYIYYVRALAFEQLHDYKNAKKQYKNSKKLGYYQAEEALKGIKEREKAWKQSQKPNSLQRKIQQAETLYNSSAEKFNAEDYGGAYHDICQSISFYPTPESQYRKAILAFFYASDFDEAIKAAQYCIENNYQAEKCYDLMARSYFGREEYDKSIKSLDKLISINRKNVVARSLKAYIKSYFLNDDSSAKADYIELVQYDGIVDFDYSYAYNMLAYWELQDSNFDKSKDYIQKSIQHNHLYGNAWDTYGELNYKLENYAKCIECMNKAIVNGKTTSSDDPHWLSNSYLYRGLAKKHIGNLAGAYRDIERAQELGEETAATELSKFNTLSLDFSDDGTFNTIIKHPSFNEGNLTIRAVELTDEYTALYLSYTNTEYAKDGYYCIDPNAFIRNKNNGEKLLLIGAENCEIAPEQTAISLNETKDFILYFPPLSPEVTLIDFEEGVKDGFRIFGIQLQN